MRLNPEQLNHVGALLGQKWGADRKCPLCAAGPWIVQPVLYALREFDGNAPGSPGDNVSVFLQVNCGNCAYTVLLNAIQMGLLNEVPAELETAAPV